MHHRRPYEPYTISIAVAAIAVAMSFAPALLVDAAGIPECTATTPTIGLSLGCRCDLQNICAKGMYCTNQLNPLILKIAGMNPASGLLTSTSGFCVPCMSGDYCPAGTYTIQAPLAETVLAVQQEILAELAALQAAGADQILAAANSSSLPFSQLGLEASVEEIEELLKETFLKDAVDAAALEGLVIRQITKIQPTDRLDMTLKLTCPAGSFCPEPFTRTNCSVGSYCPQASTMETSCNLPNLLLQEPQASIRTVENQLIINSISTAEQLVEGNFCPMNSEDPAESCPEGFYCPTPNETKVCPAGSYCSKGSTSPARCPWLSACPEGAASASASWGGAIIGVAIIAIMILAITAANLVSKKRELKAAAYIEDQERFREIMTLAGLPQPVFRAFQDIECKVTISFKELTLTIGSDKRVLNGVTGEFPHSQLIAVMGGSGCGKSTFLNVLCGKANYGKMGGQVLINGHEAPLHVIRSIKGFVPQDDTVHEDLTVEENLIYSAAVRLPSIYTKEKRKQLVLATSELLQLTHVSNSVVGSVKKRGISGGQRKRVNIGVELVAQPSVLFLDEPTSGLDATGSLAVLQGLKRLCSRGLSSIMVIHQPRYSIFELFDQVMLLGYGGYQVFLGPSTKALPYFDALGFSLPANENPADFFLDVIQGKVGCESNPDFAVEDLFSYWRDNGEEWLKNSEALSDPVTASSLSGSDPQAGLPKSLSRYTSMQVPRLKQALTQQFENMDTDNTGTISPDELLKFVKNLGQDISLETASNIITIMNGGRSKTEVNLEEFLEYGLMDGGAFAKLLFVDSTTLKLEASIASVTVAKGASMAKDVKIEEEGDEGDNAAAAAPVNSSQVDLEAPADNNGASVRESASASASAHPATPSKTKSSRAESNKLPDARVSRGFLGQTVIICRRSWKQYSRDWMARLIDTAIVITVAIIIGGVQGTNWELQRVGVNFILYLIALGVVVTTGTLRVFGNDPVVRWREVASGFNVFAIFLGQSLVDLVDVFFRPLIFSAIAWSLTAPSISFASYFLVSFLVAWWSSGQAYLLSLVVPQESATLAGACIPLVFAGFLNGYNPTLESMGAYSPMFLVTYLSYARWATEALMVVYFNGVDIQFRVISLGLLRQVGFCGYVFQESPDQSAGGPGSSMMPGVEQAAATPLLQKFVVQVFSIFFPGVYSAVDTPGSNATTIIGAFSSDCEGATNPEVLKFCGILEKEYQSYAGYDQCNDAANVALIVLFAGGVALRLFALLAIAFMNRGKMV